MAGFDAHTNLAVSAVVTAPTPATSGTTLTVTAGEGARFPAPPFNATVWPVNAMPTPLTGEVIRVTGRTTDSLTIVRAQEGSTARVIGTGDLIAATITAKTLTDLETRAALKDEANIFTSDQQQLGPAANPRLVLMDNAQPVDARVFRIMDSVQNLQFEALNDALSVATSAPLKLTRAGDAVIGRDLFEKGRTTALGHWIDVPFNAANFSAVSGGTWTVGAAAIIRNRYTRIGTTLVWSFYISWFSGGNTLAGTVVQLQIAAPLGLPLATGQIGTVQYAIDAGARLQIPVDATSSGATVQIAKSNGANWTAGAPGLVALLIMEAS